MKHSAVLLLLVCLLAGCGRKNMPDKITGGAPFDWKAANLYFLLTDRFYNGNTANDNPLHRDKPAALLRGFMGGDIKGVTKKIEEGYFTDLGINAIWLTPIVEQIHGSVDEGTGHTYAFHGYWTRDWTALDPNFGTRAELKELVDKAHARGIRIVLDAVVNHTGPVTELDPVYPDDWVRTGPKCTYHSYKTYIECTLVDNLPDVLTESTREVGLPAVLAEKWKKEGRYEKEMASLDAFFKRTGYPRTPKYYIMKWLADYIAEFGIDGYRVDTAKHIEEGSWADFYKICLAAFDDYKKKNPGKKLDDSDFFMLGEVYGYGLHGKQLYDFGDRKVNYFENGLGALINFDFKGDANKDYEDLFSYYNQVLMTDLGKYAVANYISSHDDSGPFDKKRTRTFESASKLLLAPGISQVYYGDETGRLLEVPGANGDANLRSFMNWEDIANSAGTRQLLDHYQKLGQFRGRHPAIGAGKHQAISKSPYVFSRTYARGTFADQVIVGLKLPSGEKKINVSPVFKDGDVLWDAYSKQESRVKSGQVTIHSPFDIVLLERRQ